jgi:tRNA(Ile)-lysidine synthase
MRLPIRIATEIRARELILPKQRVLIALSGGADSVALLLSLVELSKKRDLQFSLCAAHLNHGLRGIDADADEAFCQKIGAHHGIKVSRAFVDTPALAKKLKRSLEESARIARHSFLAAAAAQFKAEVVAVAHHADDRIESLLYRLCRGTGLSGLQGIRWMGPVSLPNEPDVAAWIQWRTPFKKNSRKSTPPSPPSPAQSVGVVRPLLACTRLEILAYLESKQQPYCTDATNFDSTIPRNALRNLVLPLLEEKVHPGVRSALFRLAEEAELQTEKHAWRREWLSAFAKIESGTSKIELFVPRHNSAPTTEELKDVLEVLKEVWNLGAIEISQRHLQALQRLFEPISKPRHLQLPSNLQAYRHGRTVVIQKPLIPILV